MTGSLRDEGVVKYQAFHQNADAPVHPLLNQLDEVRTRLFDLGLVGVYPDGIGYGNVSIRYETGCIISGTASGGIRILGPSGYCYVRSFNLQKNIVYTEGPINASSESMTHCAIYQANPLVQCVLHIHARELWERLMRQGCESTFGVDYMEELVSQDYPEYCPFCGESIQEVQESYIEDEEDLDNEEWD